MFKSIDESVNKEVFIFSDGGSVFKINEKYSINTVDIDGGMFKLSSYLLFIHFACM